MTKRVYHIVFADRHSHDGPRFVEVEDGHGRSIAPGRWIERDDGLWVLELPRPDEDESDEIDRLVETQVAAMPKRRLAKKP